MKHIIILASGSGTNAENIIKYFENSQTASVRMVLSNKKEAKVLDRANSYGKSAISFNKTAFTNGDVLDLLKNLNPDLIVLAGFLWKVPSEIITAFPDKIINIHPALLPNYGGKGMYGLKVHQAIITNKEVETGITIHYVNENYDEGNIIFQAKTKVTAQDTAESVAQKVHQLEYKHFPEIIEKLLNG
ncbi:phosphoribosylglycinamide formyltransferase [Galbibacter pacificus]|uniref:Phosphoribosylglycinamide formyltransferase n=1 Tax=Galbibacter pacificus TaxID=2996052 RepID=A0ABT6FSC2_9FLAO|nr:phosphoribosylglycinamide formyltransferase [Galbibacter pacificus]MDG3582711.1 phosphoribosylglycinamide formyltransferase [Galbibacter pacificus]MDG3586170.1 phosphoribosylglycinamide formyltransferase [Galbibacter pacificus]